jgi:ankyrin repeat protein
MEQPRSSLPPNVDLERYSRCSSGTTIKRINWSECDGNTLLLLESPSRNARIIELILERGGHNINHKNKLGNTAWIYASRNGHLDAAKKLLELSGMNVSIRNEGGKSASDIVKEGGYVDVLALLVLYTDNMDA